MGDAQSFEAGIASLGRALLRLGEAPIGASGHEHDAPARLVRGRRVEVQGPTLATLFIARGALLHLDVEDGRDSLGDAVAALWPRRDLRRSFALEGEGGAAERAGQGARALRAGERLVAAGVLSAPELAMALRWQSRRRLRRILAWPDPRVRVAEATLPATGGAPSLREAVLDAVRSGVAPLPHKSFALAERWRLQPRAEELMRQVSLAPAEEAVFQLLRSGASGGDVLRALGSSRAVRQTLQAWRALGLLGPPADATHALLARKRRALRRGESAAELLEVRRGVSRKQAFRTLARELHPDRFESELSAVSAEVFRALVDAERALRS